MMAPSMIRAPSRHVGNAQITIVALIDDLCVAEPFANPQIIEHQSSMIWVD
jgi:hypothetical protein